MSLHRLYCAGAPFSAPLPFAAPPLAGAPLPPPECGAGAGSASGEGAEGIRDVFDHSDELNMRDFRLLKLGRHFRIGRRTKVIVGRNEAENSLLEHAIQKGEATLRWNGGSSPLAAVMGETSDALIEKAAQILLRYTKAEAGSVEKIALMREGDEAEIEVANTLDEAAVEALRL